VSYVAGETALTLDTQGSAAERATHTFTMPTSVTDAANGAELGNNNFAAGSSASARLADTTAPAPDTVRTVDERTVAITFSERVIGTTAASEWAVGVRPAGMASAALPTATVISTTEGGTGTSVTIASADAFTGPLYVGFAAADTASHWGTGATPAVSFTAADPAALTDDVPAGDTPNALATFERDAADGTPAGLVDATFVTATELHVAFSEAVTGGAPAGWSLSGGLSVDSVAAGESPDTVVLTTSPPAVELGAAERVDRRRAGLRRRHGEARVLHRAGRPGLGRDAASRLPRAVGRRRDADRLGAKRPARVRPRRRGRRRHAAAL